jgi:hypothetical protein
MGTTEMLTYVYQGLLFAGSVAILVGLLSSGRSSVTSYIVGYSTLSLSIILATTLILYVQSGQPLTFWARMLAILTSTGPFILMLAITITMIVLLGTYGQFIVDRHVGDGYYSRATYIVAVLGFMLTIAAKSLASDEFVISKQLPRSSTLILYTLSAFAALMVYQAYVILKYFRTDGFSMLN